MCTDHAIGIGPFRSCSAISPFGGHPCDWPVSDLLQRQRIDPNDNKLPCRIFRGPPTGSRDGHQPVEASPRSLCAILLQQVGEGSLRWMGLRNLRLLEHIRLALCFRFVVARSATANMESYRLASAERKPK